MLTKPMRLATASSSLDDVIDVGHLTVVSSRSDVNTRTRTSHGA